MGHAVSFLLAFPERALAPWQGHSVYHQPDADNIIIIFQGPDTCNIKKEIVRFADST